MCVRKPEPRNGSRKIDRAEKQRPNIELRSLRGGRNSQVIETIGGGRVLQTNEPR